MENITLKKVFTTNKDKVGNLLKTRDGREYTRLAVKTEEHGDMWLSGFQNKQNMDWKEGDVVKVEVEKNGEYLNFKMPNIFEEVNSRLKKLEDKVFPQQTNIDTPPDDNKIGDYPELEEKQEGFPF